jgi:hypothetical protein
LLANPSVADLELTAGNSFGNYYYFYDRTENKFLRHTAGNYPLKPFEAFVAVRGVDPSTLKASLNLEETSRVILPGDEVNDPVLNTHYYNLQGIETQPQENGIYIRKQLRASGRVEVTKITYQKGK